MGKIVLQMSVKEAEHVYLALKVYNKAVLMAKCDNDTGDTIEEETTYLQKTLNMALSRNTGIRVTNIKSYYLNNADYIMEQLKQTNI